MSYRFCPNCESKNVLVYDGGEDESTCLDCAFTWRQYENYITVPRDVLEQMAGLKTRAKAEEDQD